MKAERWQQVNDLFQSATERAPEERAAFLDEACHGDKSLSREVESLIAAYERAEHFIESPAFEVAPELLRDDVDALIGQRLGHYRIESVLGVGGMGVVYLAQDELLGRKVALKLLPQSLVANEAQLERLKREARTASALNHPNIVTIHEIGQVNSTQYIATEFIDGITLRERLAQGPIPPNEALEIGLQIASALSVAHAAGIVHCDIKPENIMLRPDGYVKVLDFGIAKFTQQEALVEARSGGVEGTKRYMSPEQARGDALDARTDIWSLGVTLQEMAACQMSADLERVISRALAEEREARYQNAADLRAELQRLQRKAESLGRTRWRIAAAALAVLAVVAVVYVKLFSPAPTSSLHEKSVAVLPFEDFSDEKKNTFFADGVHDEILTHLAKVADLKVISRTSVMSFRDTQRNLREIAQALGVAHVVEGSVQRVGGRVRVSTQLIDARTDTHLWAERYDRELADVFAIQSEVAQKIADQLKAKISPSEKMEIERAPTASLAAFDFYTRAKVVIETAIVVSERSNLLQAAELLNQAIALDPQFFRAYCALAYTHDYAYFTSVDRTPARLALAEAAIAAAFRLRPDSGEAHLARAEHLYRGYLDYDGALAALAVAGRTLPNHPQVFALTGYILRRRGQHEEALHNLERALRLDPRNVTILGQIAISYRQSRRNAEAAAALERAVIVDPSNVATRISRGGIELLWKADPRPLRNTIDAILKENPGAAASIADVWFSCALAERDAVAANRALELLGENSLGTPPIYLSRAFGEGLLARMTNNSAKAHAAFTAARAEQEKIVQAQPDYGPSLCVLGLIDAALGRKEEALRNGRRAMELVPIEKDSLNGTLMLEYFAIICAWAGEKDLALEQLAIATRLPICFVINYGALRLDPLWEPLRGDPRFEKIVASLAPESAAPEKRIAVLPFENLSADKGDAFFADGMHDEILTNLAKVADLKVISRTSVMTFRDEKRNLPEIARSLDVAHVVEGSVQRADGRVRVTAQLIDARTDTHLWAERYDRELADVFAIQSEIAQQIANQLRAKLSPNEEAALRAKPTQDMLAYDFYLRAKEFERGVSGALPEKLNEKVLLLDQAVARDPAFVPALCLLARAHLEIYWFNLDHTAARLELASKALDAAARLEPDAGEVHLARAIGYYWGSRDYPSALAGLAHARRLLPNDADTLQFLAFIERRQGQWNESIRHLEEAQTIDPRNAATSGELAFEYVSLRRYADAARVFEQVLVWNPADFTVQLGRALVDVEAKADLRRLQSLVVGESAKVGDAALLAAVRIRLPLWQREYHAAEQVLSVYPGQDIAERGYITPREFFTGVILRGRGDAANAQSAFVAARERAAAMVTERPDDAKALMILAEIDARLGRKAEAIREGEDASKLLPVSKDAFDGPDILARLASVLAQVGETHRALDLLEQVIKMPSAPSLTRPCYGRLQLDEVWDPLRRDPRFEKILASLAPKDTNR